MGAGGGIRDSVATGCEGGGGRHDGRGRDRGLGEGELPQLRQLVLEHFEPPGEIVEPEPQINRHRRPPRYRISAIDSKDAMEVKRRFSDMVVTVLLVSACASGRSLDRSRGIPRSRYASLCECDRGPRRGARPLVPGDAGAHVRPCRLQRPPRGGRYRAAAQGAGRRAQARPGVARRSGKTSATRATTAT